MEKYLVFLLLTATSALQAQEAASLTVDDEVYTLTISYLQFGSFAF